MSEAYTKYISAHVSCVRNAFDYVSHKIPDLFEIADADYTETCYTIRLHDKSKFDDVYEYPQYDAYFYGPEKTEEVIEGFDKAWLHHIHNNPHHWQHWVLFEEDGKPIGLDMPGKYLIEMICDWWSFSWRSGELFEIFDWYEKHKSTMIMHENTTYRVESILRRLKQILDNEDLSKMEFIEMG